MTLRTLPRAADPVSSHGLRALLWCWALAGHGAALAAGKGSAQQAEMPVRVVAFEDIAGGCEPLEARQGSCVERVTWMDLRAAWGEAPAATTAATRSTQDIDETKEEPRELKPEEPELIAHLYSQVWDDLAARWNLKSDDLVSLYQEAGVGSLPPTGKLLGASAPVAARLASLPARGLWMFEPQWTGATSKSGTVEGAFHPLEYLGPGALPAPPPYVALRGFSREEGARHRLLSADEVPVEADLMDADRESSRPFFEQMFPSSVPPELPLEIAKRGSNLDAWPGAVRDRVDVPFWRFLVPELLRQEEDVDLQSIIVDWPQHPISKIRSMSELRQAVAAEHDAWALRTALLLRRYADEQFTSVHTRLLGALVQMLNPPRSLSNEQDQSRLSASGKGQSDSEERRAERASSWAKGSLSTDQLQLDQLPVEVIRRGLLRLAEQKITTADSYAFISGFNGFVKEGMYKNLRPVGQDKKPCTDTAPSDLTLAAIEAWARRCAQPAQALLVRDFAEKGVVRVLLSELNRQSPEQAELEQVRLLLDHVSFELGAALRQKVEGNSPMAVEESAAKTWTKILEKHGRKVDVVPQDIGAANPLAVCGLEEHEAALPELSIKGIKLDLLVEADDGLETSDEVLWQVGAEAPFLAVDGALGEGLSAEDALTSIETRPGPVVSKLVGLPAKDGQKRAVYRIRWTLWSGWHLLWGLQDLEEKLTDLNGDPVNRLALRTARLCDDTTLAPAELVPTLVRAGLLDPGFRPTYLADAPPAPRAGRGRKARKAPGNDAVVAKGAAGVEAASAVMQSTNAQISTADSHLASDAGTAGGEGALDAQEQRVRPGAAVGTDHEASGYLAELVADGLRQGLASEARLTLVVMDLARDVSPRRLWYWRPRSPYVFQQRRTEKEKALRGAVWALTLVPGEERSRLVRSSPGYHARGTGGSATQVTSWSRKPTVALRLSGDLGLFPVRRVTSVCVPEVRAQSPGSVKACDASETDTPSAWIDPQQDGVERAEGLMFGFAPLTQIGLSDQARVGLEIAPAVQVLTAIPWRFPYQLLSGEETRHGWETAVRAGLVAGIQFSPDPLGLARRPDQVLWGVQREDGSSRLRRLQGGLRLYGLLGPGYAGLEGTTGLDLWLGWSVRSAFAPQASLTPFHPATVLGPTLQVQYGALVVEPPTGLPEYLKARWEVMIGVRGQLRLTGRAPKVSVKAPSLPEAP